MQLASISLSCMRLGFVYIRRSYVFVDKFRVRDDDDNITNKYILDCQGLVCATSLDVQLQKATIDNNK